MPKWIIYTIRIGLILIIILFIIACVWRWEIAHEKNVITVQDAFNEIEDYEGWTPEELEQIKERRNYLKKCEAYLNELDRKYGE